MKMTKEQVYEAQARGARIVVKMLGGTALRLAREGKQLSPRLQRQLDEAKEQLAAYEKAAKVQ